MSISDERKQHLLQSSKHFCMMPWIHLHAWPDGKAFPCCTSDRDLSVGQLNQQSLKELWNSPKMRELRQRMLQDQASPECQRCYLLEKESQTFTLRQSANKYYSHHWDQVQSTGENGEVPRLKLAYFDFRFSNICNFKCHSCGPEFSSSWYEDQVAAYAPPAHAKVLRIQGPNKNFLEELKPHLLEVETAYFAGGEPLICDEHLEILEYWLKHNHNQLRIEYTTNFSELNFKNRDLLQLWKRFKRVEIYASLDASHSRAEYLRKGTKWSKIEANRKRLLQEAPEIGFWLTPTISLLNVWNFLDFHREWLAKGLVEPDRLRLNILTFPENMSLDAIPGHLRPGLQARYAQALTDILKQLPAQISKENLIRGYQSVIQFLERPARPELLPSLRERLQAMDKIRKEDFKSSFPELGFLNEKTYWPEGEYTTNPYF